MKKLSVVYDNQQDKIDIVDTSNPSCKRILGHFVKVEGQSYSFTPKRLSCGSVELPIRLTQEEQEEIGWLEYQGRDFL